MTGKKWHIAAFVIVALIQLGVVLSMIAQREVVLKKGTLFKFRTAPVDPNDPFRGKFIYLEFDANRFAVDSTDKWNYSDRVFVEIENGPDGFVRIVKLHRDKPDANHHFVDAEISYMNFKPDEAFIRYPFDRFYMEESKAPVAETIYFETAVDTTSVCWAEVFVLNGKAVISDVKIDGVSIVERSKTE